MKNDFDLVLAQHALQQIGTAQAAAHHVDSLGKFLVHEFAGGNPVAHQRRHGCALLQQAFREPSAHQSRGASDKDGTVSPEAVLHLIVPANYSCQTFQGACFALQSWFKYSYSRYVSMA